MKKIIVAISSVLLGLLIAFTLKLDVRAAEAQTLPVNISISNGNGAGNITDNNYNTALSFKAGDTVTVSSDSGIKGLYIAWDRIPSPWTLNDGASDILCGQNGFLHEYVEIPSCPNSFTMKFDTDCSICYLNCYGEGDLPSNVQVWQPSCEKADIMIMSSHADDEVLFFGGILPTYAKEYDAAVQIVYLTEFWTTTPIREHEKLDGLWTCGITNYPVCGDFKDVYCSDLDNAKLQYSEDDITLYMTQTIRRFKPQVVVTHDINGEYGHGFHCLVFECTKNAVEFATDENYDPDSASVYGVWDVPKTYSHLWAENQIRLDLRHPIESMGGKTALEIASEGYTKHVSQQWCWFYVSDEYEYSCADFGLMRTSVGVDENNDLMDHLKTYKVQEEERIAAEEEAARLEKEAKEKEELEAKQQEEEKALEEEKQQKKSNAVMIVLFVVLAVVILVAIIIVVKTSVNRNKRRRNRRNRY